MTDIDFDELDRAVSSLMNQRQQQDPAPQPTAPVASSAPAPVDLTPPLAAPEAAPSSVATEAPSPQVVAPRRTGRFMDVVHPSSQMVHRSVDTAPSRTGATLQPVSQDIVPEASGEPVAAALDSPSQDSTVSQSTDDTVIMAQKIEESLTASSQQRESADAAPVFMPAEPALDAGLTSPFIDNPVVEKRPLGAPSSFMAVSEQPDGLDAPVDVSPEADAAEQATLAPEFDQALMALESAAVESAPATPLAVEQPPADAATELTADTVATAPEVAPTMEQSIADTSAAPAATPEMLTSVAFDAPVAAADIAPEPLPMFDAASQQPTQTTKKSTMSTLLVIVLLLLLGAAGGAAAYYVMLLQ